MKLLSSINKDASVPEGWVDKLSPWQRSNRNAIIKSKVDNQDDIVIDDLLDYSGDKEVDVGAAAKNIASNAIQNTSIGEIINKVKNFQSDISGKTDYEDTRPATTSLPTDDKIGIDIGRLKKYKYYKNIKIISKNLGLYNNLNNALGNAAGLFTGTLGRTTLTNLADSALASTGVSEMLLGLGAATVATRIKNAKTAAKENGTFSSLDLHLDEILEINAANWYTYLYNKPGKYIRGNNEYMIDYISPKEFSPWGLSNKDVDDFFKTKYKSGSKSNELIDAARRPNKIGCLYVEPFYNNEGLKPMFIPFEFNPEITDGGVQAKYNNEELLGRVLNLQQYMSTNSSTVTVSTKYIALAPEGYDGSFLSYDGFLNSELINDNWDFDNYDINNWEQNWTTNKIRNIEMCYRSLVYPYIKNATFVRPPIVKIKLGVGDGYTTDLLVSDLYKYPEIKENKEEEKNTLQVTRKFNQDTNDLRYKSYVVTDVKIEPLENWGMSYEYFGGEQQRRGFKVSITLTETTKNFLDFIPNYATYNNYFNQEISTEWADQEESTNTFSYNDDYGYDKQYFDMEDEAPTPQQYETFNYDARDAQSRGIDD